jgi:hypothetical protein
VASVIASPFNTENQSLVFFSEFYNCSKFSAISAVMLLKSGLLISLHFLMMSAKLVHLGVTKNVSPLNLLTKCTSFADDCTLFGRSYYVKSNVSTEAFNEFVSSLNGNEITITTELFTYLNRLCNEFGYRELAGKLVEFRDSKKFDTTQFVKGVYVQESIDTLENRIQEHELRLLGHDRCLKSQEDQYHTNDQRLTDALDRCNIIETQLTIRTREVNEKLAIVDQAYREFLAMKNKLEGVLRQSADAKSVSERVKELEACTARNTKAIQFTENWMKERNDQVQKLQVQVVNDITIHTRELGNTVQNIEEHIRQLESSLDETKGYTREIRESLNQEIEKIGQHDQNIEELESASVASQDQLDVLVRDYFGMELQEERRIRNLHSRSHVERESEFLPQFQFMCHQAGEFRFNLERQFPIMFEWSGTPDSKILKKESAKQFFKKFYVEFLMKKFRLLYRGTQNGFDEDPFRGCCAKYTNTVIFIEAQDHENKGMIYGGIFIQVTWNSHQPVANTNKKSSLFMIAPPSGRRENMTMKFTFNERSPQGARPGGICLMNNCNRTGENLMVLGGTYCNERGCGRECFPFQIQELEVFEISD